MCLRMATVKTFDIYDEGVLLATVDKESDESDGFINGPNGRIATYWPG